MATEAKNSFGAVGNDRDYTSLVVWQADNQRDLTAATGDDTTAVLEIYDDWPGDPSGNNESLILAGWVMDPTTDNMAWFRPAPGEGFPDTVDTSPEFAGWTGAKLTRGGSGNITISIGLNQCLTVTDLAIINTRLGSNSNADSAIQIDSGCIQAERCFITTYGGQNHTENGSVDSPWPSYFRSCAFTRDATQSLQRSVYRGYGHAALENCTIAASAPITLSVGNVFFDRGSSTLNMSNTVTYNIGPTYSSFSAISGSNNASDLTPGGSSPVTGVVSDADFEGVSTGNFRNSSAGILTVAGATLPSFDYDIVDYTRQAPWDVGAFELQGAPPTGIKEMYIKDGGIFVKYTPYVKVGGTFQEVDAYVLESGVWVPVHEK